MAVSKKSISWQSHSQYSNITGMVRHPLVAEQRKHVALVLGFGAGAFDVSVVETTEVWRDKRWPGRLATAGWR